uniref:Predicted protein n=1 Tax=Hordeum vulgare subsp. vulgare TaxID=112509 RepID=F2DS71_HORVV|nr:predicted protein [Hordeum vulgare subsp. vulgare]
MKAVIQRTFGSVDVLSIAEVPKPILKPRDVLIKLKSIATNPTDIKSRENIVNGPALTDYKILGWDGVGIVEAVGSNASFYKAGDHVWFAGSRFRQGCNAEYCAVDERIVGKKPTSLTWEEAASFPLTGITAWEVFFDSMKIGKSDEGKTILITAGAGGVGSIAIQIAKKILKLKVIATASNPKSIELSKRFGADFTIDHTKNLEEQLNALGFKTVDFILETNNLERNLETFGKIIAPWGRIATIVNGAKIDPSHLLALFSKSVTLSFEMMFTRSAFEVDMERQKEILDQLAKLADEKVLEHRAFTVFPSVSLENIREAHRMQESGKTHGKIVLTADFI